MVDVHGTCDARFHRVHEEFERNFARRSEFGAACAVYFQGEKVVDLWGGCRDAETGLPWTEDTLVLVFSTTKGLSAMATAVAHSRGWLDLDQPVAAYWPEFAQQGKDRITVRQLFAHQAGLAAIDQELTAEILADRNRMTEILARQRPAWTPGERHGYHTFSLGWYQNELIRRVDPQQRSLGRFFHEEIVEPLGIEFYIGLPRDVDAGRIAVIQGFQKLSLLMHLNELPIGMVVACLWPQSLAARSVGNPKMKNAAEMGAVRYRHLEMPSSGGIGTARAVAKAYGEFATGGHALGLGAATVGELTSPAKPPTAGSRDAVLKMDALYSFGFSRPSAGFPFGSSAHAFGAPGAGGSFGFADPDQQLGFAYVTNRMGFRIFDDPRERAVRQATHASAAALGAV